MSCPVCSSDQLRVIESRPLANGTKRRRHHCENCQHRWTSWDGPRLKPGRLPGAAAPPKVYRPRLTEDEVRLILTSPDSSTKLGRQLGRTREAIAQVRRGESYSRVLPELPRWQIQRRTESCHDCIHWLADRCGMGFPDPLLEGPLFAADCAAYRQQEEVAA